MQKSLALPVLLATLACSGGNEGGAPRTGDATRQAMVAKIDSIVNAPIAAGKAAGAALAIVRGNDTIAFKAYGKADLEWDVPMTADAVFEIGSVTKQFTAAAIMQLVEQGKVDLDADFTTYLPGYATGGRKIPVRRLLNHTSGIRGYTETPSLTRRFREDLAGDTILTLVAKEPFDFEPGAQEVYNNSAFFIAGRIVEKVSGMSYADYLKKNLFDKAGMPRTSYCNNAAIVKGRAHGYDADSAGLVNKSYISHSWPYAAGSLCSTVGDLVAWNRALHSGTIIGAPAFAQLITPGELTDGTKLRYASGLALSDLAGHRAIWHDGGINGFISLNRYLPDDSLHVVLLWNSANQGLDVGEALVAAVLGTKAAPAATLDDAKAYAGEWKGTGRGQPMELTIAADSAGTVTMLPKGAPKPDTLHYLGDDRFQSGGTQLTFERTNGIPSRLRFDGAYIYVLLTRR
ncbi:MAG: beta-lactamase family protein [Cytophagaceae bacterium]|nr:beta-lactamase family protein [Gemmatimonadaceae bacterium]